MAYLVNNGGVSTLASGITTATQTSIVLSAGHGVRFPSPTGGDYTLVTLENAAGTIEIISIVGRTADTMTVGIAGSASADSAGRGRESTTATTWLTGDIIEGRATAAIVSRGGNAKTAAELAATTGAALIGTTPAGNIAATTVQAALNELDTEKVAIGSAPTSLVLTNATGLPIASGVSGLGSGIATALAVNSGSAGAPVLFNGAGGTPTSIVLTNATGTATGLTAGAVAGTTTNDNAAAGKVGEYVEGFPSAASMTGGVYMNAASISLTAGDWDVSAIAWFIPAASTSITNISAVISTVSATSQSNRSAVFNQAAAVPGGAQCVSIPALRLLLNATTTIYLVQYSNFTASTMTTGYSYNGGIFARRVR